MPRTPSLTKHPVFLAAMAGNAEAVRQALATTDSALVDHLARRLALRRIQPECFIPIAQAASRHGRKEALHAAATGGRTALIPVILEAGELYMGQHSIVQAMGWAVRNGRVDAYKALLSHLDQPSAAGSVLDVAAMEGHVKLLPLLLPWASSAHIDAAIIAASRHGHLACLEKLLASRPLEALRPVTEQDDRSTLHHALVEASCKNHIECTRRLLDIPGARELLPIRHSHLLRHAARCRHLGMMELLLPGSCASSALLEELNDDQWQAVERLAPHASKLALDHALAVAQRQNKSFTWLEAACMASHLATHPVKPASVRPRV